MCFCRMERSDARAPPADGALLPACEKGTGEGVRVNRVDQDEESESCGETRLTSQLSVTSPGAMKVLHRLRVLTMMAPVV